ncbi:4'-phosphopantetheinyl transferase superfamily protein [Streptomyces sp. NPDC047081]|uniref:4'-phosphopantetheinyl transferase family protein n=1 Tax=Streptomyces sp. NPDC047081 TaxID=3154706 RepID=UPI0033E79CA7
MDRCAGLLSPEERRRWGRIVPGSRVLYACSHAALRAVTALYGGRSASQVAFATGKFGKPYVSGDPGLRISLSHTEGLALVAVSRDGPVGVDVERVRPLRDPAGLRRQILSGWEAARWPESEGDEDGRHGVAAQGALYDGLFTRWACKEAVLKALGSGLAGDLTAVWVTPGERRGGPVRLHRVPGGASRAWGLQLVDVGPEFRAAVAVAGGGEVVRVLGMPSGAGPAQLTAGLAAAAVTPTSAPYRLAPARHHPGSPAPLIPADALP